MHRDVRADPVAEVRVDPVAEVRVVFRRVDRVGAVVRRKALLLAAAPGGVDPIGA